MTRWYHPEYPNLIYDTNTGYFINRTTGKQAGSLSVSGHRRIFAKDRVVPEHRLVWKFVFNRWPTNLIDHKNSIKDDNRISNLREASAKENASYRPANSRNKLKIKAISKQKNRYRVRMQKDGIAFDGGYFVTIEEATIARDKLAVLLHGEFAWVNDQHLIE